MSGPNCKYRYTRAIGCLLTMFSAGAFAQTAPSLGTVQGFAVLGSSTVTNTGSSIVNGNLGLSPGASVVGFPPGGIVDGTISAANAIALQAKNDAIAAYNSLASQACNTILTGQDLGGLTLTPGVYCFASTAQLTGALTLDAQGNPAAVFIFKVGSEIATASNSSVVLINGAALCNVFFQVGSSATLGTGTQFIGSIFAQASVTLTTNVNLSGRAVALTGAVTLDSNIVTVPTCVRVCKVAGAGVPLGTNFSFNVAGTPVTVPAGPAPGGTCSAVVSVPAGSAIITEALPPGIVLTGVSTLPGGLLVSSDLGAGTATVTVSAGSQTVVTFVNAVSTPIPATGFVQVCKVAGAGVALGTSFNFNVAGIPVTVAAGPAPGGTCGAAISVPVGPAVITETLPAGTTLTAVSTVPSGLLVTSNLAAGTATVTVNAGGQTIVTFVDAVTPPVPTTGFVQVCKVAGAGVAVGTNFTFNLAGAAVTIPAGAAPAGTCSAALAVPAGAAVIIETLPANTTLAGVSTFPAGSLINSNLATGAVTVTVNPGGQTIVTFLNTVIPAVPNTGFVQVCKVAGAGVAVGTSFTFNVGGTVVSVAAGPAPGGTCGTPLVAAAGPIVITETLPSGVALTAVSTLPAGLLVSSNLAAGTATVTVNAGGQTIVTFLDAAIPAVPSTGFVQVCKVAGAGVAVGTNFTFDVAGMPVTVAAGPAPGGTCGTAMVVAAGPIAITETLPLGVSLTAVSTLPAGLLVSSNLAAGTATVTVNAGGQTIVTFLNAVIPAAPATGFVQVCKVGGAGIAVGTSFSFSVGATLVTVAAGPAPGGTCSAPVVVPAGAIAITETLPAGIALTGVSTLPNGLLVGSNLPAGTATVTVIGGGQTVVTFLNAIIPSVPNTGFVQICKVAGAGIPIGTLFSFSVGGSAVTVAAGAAPGGTCSSPLTVTAGAIVITESLPAGVTLTGVSTLPAGSLLSSNLAAGTVTVSVSSGGQTIVTLVDVAPAAGFTPFLIRYLSNLNVGDSFINITNTGAAGAGLAAGTSASTTGAICANIYAFAPDEQMVSCCSCPVTPNGLVSLSARNDLISNTLTPAVPTSLVVKLLATLPIGGSCVGSSVSGTPLNLAPGLAAWATTLHVADSGSAATTETPFLAGTLSTGGTAAGIGELARLTQLCTFINANGSGFGICRSCRLGGLGSGRL